MSNINFLIDFWKNRIPKDLNPFTDPGTELHTEGEGRTLRALWTSRGVERQAQFSISIEQGVQVTFLGMNLGYRSFLVCPEMADLLGLSKMILQANKPTIYIPTKARISDDQKNQKEPAIELLDKILNDTESDATKIVMVTGDAGAGKTRVLQELVRRQANLYLSGKTSTLYLYVNAQGRALAKLTEALATELQDLRATLTYHSVATLVRAGALVLVVDGFDELIGASGYDDAFSSLSRFIEELDGQGQIVASARSTYYEEEFVSRTAAASSLGGQVWIQCPIQVQSWGDDEFTAYIKQRVDELKSDIDQALVLRNLEKIFSGPNIELRKKPLFVSKAVDLILEGVTISGEKDLLDELVSAYLEREQKEKLLDKNENSLLGKEQIALLLSTLAEEMWNQETRELDRRSVREIAEYVLVVEGIDSATQRIVIERMPTLAFLAPGERQGSITFEHELFFSVFLAHTLAQYCLRQEGSIRMLLGRSVLPPEVSQIAIREISSRIELNNDNNLQSVLNKVSNAGNTDSSRADQIRENGGRLVAAALKQSCKDGILKEGIIIENIVFPGGDLSDITLINAKFNSIAFRRTDLTRLRIEKSSAHQVYFYEAIVDPTSTKLELIGIDPNINIFGLKARDKGMIKPLYDPEELERVLISCGIVKAHENPIPKRIIPEKMLHLLEKLVHAYNRANPICAADDNLRLIFFDPNWETLNKLLIESGVITSERRATHGRPKEFLRRQVLPEQIMAGARRNADVPIQVKKLWDSLEMLSIKKG